MPPADNDTNENDSPDLTAPPEGATTPDTPEAPAEDVDTETETPEADPSPEGESTESDEQVEESDESESEDEPAAEQAPVQGKSDDLEEVRRELAALRSERQIMLELLKERQQKVVTPPPPDPTADVPDEVLRMALFGDTTGQWQSVPQDMKAKAVKLAQEHVSRTIREARSPKVRVEGLKDELNQAVFEQVAPLVEDYHSRKAREVADKHLTPLKDPVVEKRAKELFAEMPGSKSTNWKDIERALQAAASQARAEALEKRFQEQENRSKAKQVQKGSTGGTKLKSGTKGSSPKPSIDNPPPMKPGERLSDYNARIKTLLG